MSVQMKELLSNVSVDLRCSRYLFHILHLFVKFSSGLLIFAYSSKINWETTRWYGIFKERT